MLVQTQGTGDNTSVTDSASSAGLSSDRHEQDLAGFETTQDLTSTGQSQSSSVSPLVSLVQLISPPPLISLGAGAAAAKVDAYMMLGCMTRCVCVSGVTGSEAGLRVINLAETFSWTSC